MRVYYAHHRWKQGTGIVPYEAAEIEREFHQNKLVDELSQEEVEILDPIDKNSPRPNLALLDTCGSVVFSSVSGMLDRETYEDVVCAINLKKSVYYFDKGRVFSVGRLSDFQSRLRELVFVGNPEVYAIFDIEKGR